MPKKAIDFLLWQEGFYPFSIKFNLKESIKKFDDQLKELEIDKTSKSVFFYSEHFNEYFKEICNALGEALQNSKLSEVEFVELLIADLNRTELLISEDTFELKHLMIP